MISGKRLAPRRLGSYFNRLPARQIGIGQYEQVSGHLGDDVPVTTTAAVTQALPKVVAAPESSNQATEAARAGAKGALQTLVLFGLFCASAWVGNRVVRG